MNWTNKQHTHTHIYIYIYLNPEASTTRAEITRAAGDFDSFAQLAVPWGGCTTEISWDFMGTYRDFMGFKWDLEDDKNPPPNMASWKIPHKTEVYGWETHQQIVDFSIAMFDYRRVHWWRGPVRIFPYPLVNKHSKKKQFAIEDGNL